MTRTPTIACLTFVLITSSCATTQTRSDLAPQIETATLDNGLTIYLVEDRSAPITAFQYWVKVGSADEHEGQPGITGLSHFFEHMMFRGTPKHPDYFNAVSSKGAQLNAFTWLDVTVYWEKFASEHLEFILDIESDRLANMSIDLLNLEPEREVVKSERRLRTENSASGSLREAVSAALFQHHSYHWPTVGWMRDLNAISIEEARAYHGRFYVPNNAYVILVGDFDTKDALAKMERFFGSFPRGNIDRPVRKTEPTQMRTRRTWVAKPTASGLLNVSYRSPAGGDPDFTVLEVIDAILTKGRGSRAQKSLVYGESPVAKSISPFLFPFRDPGIFQLELKLLPGIANVDAEKRLEQVITKLRTTPVDARVLARAVAQLRADIVRMMTTTQSRAQLMGFYIRATGDPALPWKRLQQYGEVTPADIVRVANQWLTPEKRVIGHAVKLSQLNALTAELIHAWPQNPQLDELLAEAVKYSLMRQQWSEGIKTAALEDKAIHALIDRASREQAAVATAKQRQAIDTYLETADQGVKKRRSALAALRNGLNTKKASLDAMKEAILEKLASYGEHHRAKTALGILQNTSAQPLDEKGGKNDMRVAEWALHFITEAAVNSRGPANEVLTRLAANETNHPVLTKLYHFAYTLQRIDSGEL